MVVWKNEERNEEDLNRLSIIDGFNRYSILSSLEKDTVKVIKKEFSDKNEIFLWIYQNQISRRNLSMFSRVEGVLKLKYIIKEKQAGQKKFRFLKNLKTNQHSQIVN